MLEFWHRELVEPVKAVIADLWRTRRVGKTAVSGETVKKALSGLTAETLDGLLDRYARQAGKEPIQRPGEYLKALILDAPQNAALARFGGYTEDFQQRKPSYDIGDYVKISMQRFINLNSNVK